MAEIANVIKHSEMLGHGSNQYEEKVDVPRGTPIKSAKERVFNTPNGGLEMGYNKKSRFSIEVIYQVRLFFRGSAVTDVWSCSCGLTHLVGQTLSVFWRGVSCHTGGKSG